MFINNNDVLNCFTSGLRFSFESHNQSSRDSCLDALNELSKSNKILFNTLLRTAVNNAYFSAYFLQQLYNLWTVNGKESLKPGIRKFRIFMLTDYTASNLLSALEIIGASRGLEIKIDFADYDSIENIVLNPQAKIYQENYDAIIFSLSEHWCNKYVQHAHIVQKEKLSQLQTTLESLLEYLKNHSQCPVYVTSFLPSTFPTPNGFYDTKDSCGRQSMLMRLNQQLVIAQNEQLSIIDIQTAVHIAGGRKTLGCRSYFLAKIGFEPDAVGFVAAEIIHTISGGVGQHCRALVTDWDNTIWGGELAELGVFGVRCGLDTAEELAYYHVQLYMKQLKNSGILLNAASRNHSSQAILIDKNDALPLCSDDFVSLQVNLCPKSQSIIKISNEIGFGSEYMLFVDDNLFELAEVLIEHPYIDVILANEDPQRTLEALSHFRCFNQGFLQAADQNRSEQIKQLNKQQTIYRNNEDFLKNINIQLTIYSYTNKNKARLLQLIQKTNQFNLTTRRYKEKDLISLIDNGAKVFAVEYEDSFGGQGIISLIIIKQSSVGCYFIDTWLMSCRVLNRSVEFGVFEWIISSLKVQKIKGLYIPTVKNILVKDFYQKLGFFCVNETSPGITEWLWDVKKHAQQPNHQIKIIKGTTEP